MSPAELRDDIAARGLRDPITLTPDGLLLDGRNRALACVMAGVEPDTVVYDGDPWLFSLSRNKHRRHLTVDEIAMVAAQMVTTSRGAIGARKTSKLQTKGLTVKQAAKALEVPKTAVESARVVTTHGTPEEKKAIASRQRGALRKAADRVRSERRQALAPSTSPKSPANKAKSTAKPKSTTTTPAPDPIDEVAREIVTQCADGEWRSPPKIATTVRRAEDAVRKALKALGKLVVAGRKNSDSGEHEYWIAGKGDAALRHANAAKDEEIVKLKAKVAELEAELNQATAPAKATTPAKATAPTTALEVVG
jgi:hypothetical protein